jgi:proliferating cell nuclear antigen PCNA
MAMEIHLNDTLKIDVFGNIFQILKNFNEHVNLVFTPTTLSIQTMDSAKISILELEIPNTWFMSYTCPSNVTLGINATLFSRIFCSREKSQNVCIKYDYQITDTLYCTMSTEHDNDGAFDRYFEFPLISLDEDIMSIPEIEYQAEFIMPSQKFATLMQQLKTFGETVDIECNENKIALIAKSIEQGKMTVEIGIDDLSEFTIDENCELKLSFALHYLYMISSFNKISRNVSIHLHSDYPIRIDYVTDGVSIKYYLAPKLQE